MTTFEAVLPMKHHSHYDTLGGVVGTLHAGKYVRSDVEPESDGPPWMGRAVYLKSGDMYCDACRCFINPGGNYHPEAWVNILARQKLKHGGTWCQDCFTAGEHQRDTPETEADSDERAFK